MFFYIAKLFWLVAAPSNLIGTCLVLAVLAFLSGRIRAGRVLAILACSGYVVAGFLPLGNILLRPLEDRFSRPQQLVAAPTGIIVLGGGMDEQLGAARNTTELTESGDRMTEAVALAFKYKTATIYFAGGSASLRGSKHTEAAAAMRFFLAQGVSPDRIKVESKSRNTRENAELVKRLAAPKTGQTWLLVTSARHMPRSIGIFRDVGFPVIAWPVDYLTRGTSRDWMRPVFEASRGLRYTDRAVKEWVGLIVYYMTGRSSALLPSPDKP